MAVDPYSVCIQIMREDLYGDFKWRMVSMDYIQIFQLFNPLTAGVEYIGVFTQLLPH